MNSQRPQNSKPDFPEAFDGDELEIDVSYEEISPEEQLKIKQRASEATSSFDENIDYVPEPIVDIWLEEEVGNSNNSSSKVDDDKLKKETEITDSETEPSLDDDTTPSNELEGEILSERRETEPSSNDATTISHELEGEILSERRETEITNSENEPLLDDATTISHELEGEILSERRETEPSSNDATMPSNEELEGEILSERRETEITNSETKSLLDDATTISHELEGEILSERRETEITNSETESSLDDATTISHELEGEILSERREAEITNSETEPLLDDVTTPSNDLEGEILSERREAEIQEESAISNEQNSLESLEEKEMERTNSANTEPEQSRPELVTPKTELIADSWLDESENIASSLEEKNKQRQDLSSEIAELKQQKFILLEEIKTLQAQKQAEISKQSQELARNLAITIDEGTKELKERRNNLLIDVEKLERRRERIYKEMNSTYAGASQDLAVRIQGFKEYLVGSLQDLASAAERLDLPKPDDRRRVPQGSTRTNREDRQSRNISPQDSSQPQFREETFADRTKRIRQLLEQYRTQPDYYGSPWQLRRTFEPVHAEKVQNWFFEQGGRGAIKGMGSRLQNILVASAVISILYRLYRDRCRILVLVDTPEKLGEWRKGLCDCLGISRNDFGSNRGIVLFESADILVQRAERLLEDKLLPLIIIDETEELINLNLLKFPLWLAFAEKPQPKSSGYLY